MTRWTGRWNARDAAFLVIGLMGCGASGEDAGASAETTADGALATGIDDEGFEAAPEVAFPAPGTTPFGGGHLLCRERRSEISDDVANTLGFDAAGDRAALEATQVLDVLASWNDVKPTTVHYRGRIARIIRVERRAPVGFPVAEAVPAGCPSGVEYELVQQLYTEDGAVRGAFLTHVPATPLGEPTARQLSAEVDLRNFTGELPVGWLDAAAPSFAAANVSWSVGDVDLPQFDFTATLWGAPSQACDWAYCRADSDLGLPISYGVTTAPGLETFDQLLGSLGLFNPRTLAQAAADTVKYTPHVRIWVTANAANSADPTSANRVVVNARAGGDPVAADALDLAPNLDHLEDGIVSGFIDVGPLPEGTTLELEVEDTYGLGSLRSHVIIDDCDVGRGTAACLEPGCKTETSLPIFAAGCLGRASYPAR